MEYRLQDTMNELIKCPFCGNEMLILKCVINDRQQIGHYVQCVDCLSQGPIIGSAFGELNNDQMIQSAIDKWNRRV